MNRRSVIGAVVVIGGLALAAGAVVGWKHRAAIKGWFSGGPGQAPMHWEPAVAVKVVGASTTAWQTTADLVGTAIAKQSVTVQNEVGGRIQEVHFESGGVVEEGQVLVTLESSQEQADLAAQEAAVKVAEAGVKVAESRIGWGEANLKRIEQAVAGRVASQSDLDKARTDLDQYRAEMEQANAEVVAAVSRAAQVRTLLEKKTIKAPFRARAGLRNVHLGQYLAQGAQIVMLQSVADTIHLDFAIPQEHMFRVKLGEKVMATSAVFGPEPEPITVVAVDAVANPSTRNVRVRGEVSNPGERLRPGMAVEIRVPLGDVVHPVVVPTVAVRRASRGDHVFVIGPSTREGDQPGTLRAVQRFVTLGPAMGEITIVADGLKEGEQIATEGSFKLRDGALVMLGDPGTPPGGPASEPAGDAEGAQGGAQGGGH